MKINGDDILFESTGKKESANCGIIGLCNDLVASEGYDSGFGGYLNEDLTKSEREELADYMISLWEQYKNK